MLAVIASSILLYLAHSESCLNARDTNIVIKLGLKKTPNVDFLSYQCRKCFWELDLCSLDEGDDCDEEFSNCSGFPDPPTSVYSIWKSANAQPNIFFTKSTTTDVSGVYSLQDLANGSVLAKGLINSIVTIRSGQVRLSNASKLTETMGDIPTDKLQVSSISHRFLSNGSEVMTFLDFNYRVHFSVRGSKQDPWTDQTLSIAAARPAMQIHEDVVHVLYPCRDLSLQHWTSAAGFLHNSLATRAPVSLHSIGTQMVMLIQNILTAGLEISMFDCSKAKWSFPQSTSQNVDIDTAPVFITDQEQLNSHYVLFLWNQHLHVMKFRDLGVSPPSWMGDLAKTIGDHLLTNLMIPGSHDSGSYGITTGSSVAPLSPAEQDLGDLFANPVFSPIARHVARRWFRAQGTSFLDQLYSGIRYFDLRLTIGSSASPPIRSPQDDFLSDLFFEHFMISVPVANALQQIHDFLEDNPHEVLLLDLQHMTGVDMKHRISLYDEIERLFSSGIADRRFIPSETSLNRMWSEGLQLIVITGDDDDDKREWLWPRSHSLVSPWPNVAVPSELKQALESGFLSRRPDQFFVLQGVCTENSSTIVESFFGHKPQSLRDLASSTSPLVLEWLQAWPQMNIVVVDWTEDSSLVAYCIERNIDTNTTNR